MPLAQQITHAPTGGAWQTIQALAVLHITHPQKQARWVTCRLTAVPAEAEEANEGANVRVHEPEELHSQPLQATPDGQDRVQWHECAH